MLLFYVVQDKANNINISKLQSYFIMRYENKKYVKPLVQLLRDGYEGLLWANYVAFNDPTIHSAC